MKSVNEQLSVIMRGVTDVVIEADLRKKLEKGKPLTIKLGIDPTGSDIHLGHTVTLNKLRQFQDLGHNAVLIIGDYTAMIGDPSGRMSERPQLTREDIMKNVESYEKQAYKILDKNRLKIVYNGDWFSKLTFGDVVGLVSKFTLAQMLEHDYFDKRFKEGVALSLHELLYPIMQGYDSVMIKADVELGGTDQRFNVIAGRYLQKESGQEPQVGLFTPILIGTDGVNKMSKSLGNYIGLNDSSEDKYGKVMSIPDDIMMNYFELLTDVPLEEVRAMEEQMKKGSANPRDFKRKLALSIVAKYDGEKAAEAAAAHFDSVFSKKEIPYEENTLSWDRLFSGKDAVTPMELLLAAKMAPSSSEAGRVVKQGGFTLNEEKITDIKHKIAKSSVPFNFKAGKRNYGRVEK